jgi:hypothetical protein
VSLHPEETGLGSQKSVETPLLPEKNQGEQEKALANLWSRKKITKQAHTRRGQEIKWEIPAKIE